MKIKKILNNNAVIVQEGTSEKIAIGPGIAFQKKKNDIIAKNNVEKVFVMEDNDDYEKFQEILSTLPIEHIKIAEEIISYAEGALMTPLNDHVHVALTDHLSFAFERLKQGYEINNKLLQEIKILYPEEYEVGLWAQKRIKERLSIEIPNDEVGYIALHIHTAKMNRKSLKPSLDVSSFVNDVIGLIEKEFNTSIHAKSLSYQRLLTHLRFAFQRIQQKEPFHDMDEEMLEVIKKKHKKAFDTAEKIGNLIKEVYQFDLPISEQAYIALHIQRLSEK
ncbi:levansucrase [Anaerobacillus alkalilacustris]|uniref:Levansucrase n=1 Tax=Anaerobacillus alkalilacustris TaxID=393763 RepID=A0A1S2LET4_9BACI|nr:PRD domain-containing protein [Anaerobacillus alkalilacustris]OIJ10750.1 levansucrase [Anaerobacillus alkalilacustris]